MQLTDYRVFYVTLELYCNANVGWYAYEDALVFSHSNFDEDLTQNLLLSQVYPHGIRISEFEEVLDQAVRFYGSEEPDKTFDRIVMLL